MDELETQITEEIAAITDWLQTYLGRPSRWNGEVELSDEADTYGKALWNGTIVISRDLASSDLRWRTELHEVLHHFSTGLSVSDYLSLPGWEEGIVEQLQRTLRGTLFISLSINLPMSVFAVIESDHQFNRYIEALETMRAAIKSPAPAFYELLFAIPLKDRPASLIEAGRLLPPDEYRDFQRIFALAFSKLRGD